MKRSIYSPHPSGMSRTDVLMIIFSMVVLFCLLFLAAARWKRGADRSATIMNIRNCQQVMRSHQGMNQRNPGDPFTKRDLSGWMKFPENISVFGGQIVFIPGTVVCAMSDDPAVNDDHLWLKVDAPGTKDHVGQYGFKNIAESTHW